MRKKLMHDESMLSQSYFLNKVIDKKQFVELIVWAFSMYGITRAANMADQLKDLGFYYATKAGISLSIEDLRIPPAKKNLLNDTFISIRNTDTQYIRAEITAVERFQKVIDTWHNMSEILRQEIIKYFQEIDPLNSIHMMSFSGARGNMSQVRQLVGMRGLMSDPQGQIIDLPIISNFREGLTVTEYFISSYGARKGLVDTALRTADSGYLTRRLVDVSQHIIIRQVDCQTSKGIILEDMSDNQKVLMPLEQELLGRVLAENIYDPCTGMLIAYANQDISSKQASKIVNLGINKVLIRSPLTCEGENGVCQRCYGWNLAHRRLVDIGEAVGIIAAQSIGEPGTQLTMRTFHTGGVFTGELAQKIYSPISGIIKYPQDIKLTNIRTKHGDLAFLIEQDTTIFVESRKRKKVKISLTKGTSLLVAHNYLVKEEQVIAESPLSNQLMTEEAEKQVITDLSGRVQFVNLTIQETNNNQHVARLTKKAGLVWVLSGQVYNIPDDAQIIIKSGDKISPNIPLAQQKFINEHSGHVRIFNCSDDKLKTAVNIQIITAYITLPNSKVYLDNNELQGSYIIETNTQEKFVLQAMPGEKISNGHIIANLISDTYTTTTGGIIKYLDLPVATKKNKLLKNSYEILGTGYILWISEETHEINKDPSLLFVQHGDLIEAGTELIKNVFAKISGIIEIVKRENAIREIIIKPGKLYLTKIKVLSSIGTKRRGFLRPGDKITEGIHTNKLVYWEYIQKSEKVYIFVRPVTVYSVPRKYYSLEPRHLSDKLRVKIIKTTKFRDGERAKSVNGVDLVTTYIVAYTKDTFTNLYTTIEYERHPNLYNIFQLKLVTSETVSIKNNYFDNIYQSTKILVKNNQKIACNTIIAKTETLSHVTGQIEGIHDRNKTNRRVLVFSDTNQYKVYLTDNDKVVVKLHQWIYAGDYISQNNFSKYSGQIIGIKNNVISIRIARPYLLSNAADLHISNNDFVQQGESIATLKFQRRKTKDIVQGLPKIEEILEVRKKADTLFKPNHILANYFKRYIQIGLDLYSAAKLSLQKVQLRLVQEVQLVYQSQKVDISDKHIEVIVKQMTSKVEIERGGNTGYLPGEIVDLDKIETLNKIVSQTNMQQAVYFPILLGITKASLNTDSFISAASFQETTRVLTEAAISGKLDWLKGLKENVIIGRLIPAGTGFNFYSNDKNHTIIKNTQNSSSLQDQGRILAKDLDDIILDDRVEPSYNIIN